MKEDQQIIEMLHRGVELCSKFRKSVPMSVQKKLMDKGDIYSVPLPSELQQEIIEFCYEAQSSLTSHQQDKLHHLFARVNKVFGFERSVLLIHEWRVQGLTLEQVELKIEKNPLQIVQ